MLTFLTILGIYFGGMASFALWDAYLGFGVEFDGGDWPPLWLALVAWPIALPFAIGAKVSSSLDDVRETRVIKAAERKRMRVAVQKEQERILQQVEEEISNVEVEDQDSTPYARIVSGSSGSYARRTK
jgi:hypothetical protein